MEPEAADTVKLIGPGVAFPLAVIVTVCDGYAPLPEESACTWALCAEEPGVSVKVAGSAETPVGRPESETFTELEKPLSGVIEIEIA